MEGFQADKRRAFLAHIKTIKRGKDELRLPLKYAKVVLMCVSLWHNNCCATNPEVNVRSVFSCTPREG